MAGRAASSVDYAMPKVLTNRRMSGPIYSSQASGRLLSRKSIGRTLLMGMILLSLSSPTKRTWRL
jgi:hypothetical protein